MPMIIEYIDKIARDKKRDVLYLVFKDDSKPHDLFFDYENFEARKNVIAWLDENQISYAPCMGEASENSMRPYRGYLYIDVPFDKKNELFIKLSEFLENPDGSMKIKGVIFGYYPLEMAKKNEHHDAPGFWDEWAKNF
jgi:hypothetical protein